MLGLKVGLERHDDAGARGKNAVEEQRPVQVLNREAARGRAELDDGDGGRRLRRARVGAPSVARCQQSGAAGEHVPAARLERAAERVGGSCFSRRRRPLCHHRSAAGNEQQQLDPPPPHAEAHVFGAAAEGFRLGIPRRVRLLVRKILQVLTARSISKTLISISTESPITPTSMGCMFENKYPLS